MSASHRKQARVTYATLPSLLAFLCAPTYREVADTAEPDSTADFNPSGVS